MAGESVINARALERGAPAAADVVAFTGGLGIVVGVLLLTADFYGHGHGRVPGIALFAVLVAAGFLALGLLPAEIHPAAVTLIVAGVPGTLGWWILPHAHRFADIRPFLILTILAWGACWVAPRTRGRTIFVAAALIFLWLWILGEAAGTDAYSASPIPSPPAHTTFSLSALHRDVTIGQLDTSSPLYPLAAECQAGDNTACDTLFNESSPGSDFEQFADTCANRQPTGSGDHCADDLGGNFGTTPSPFPTVSPPLGSELPGPAAGIGAGSSDKSTQIGLVSLLFGIAYVGALFAFDRRRWRGLGTALVIPGLLALFTGTEVLGNAVHHAWFGGLLTFVAGIAFALIGDFGARRFTTWAGGVFAALGLYTFAADVTNYKSAFTGLSVKLVRPGLITIAFGAGLVALAWYIASFRARYPGAPGSPRRVWPSDPPPVAPLAAPPSAWSPPSGAPPAAPWQPAPPSPPNPPWQSPDPPPSAPPPSAPWQSHEPPPPAAPWQPPPAPPAPPPQPGDPPA